MIQSILQNLPSLIGGIGGLFGGKQKAAAAATTKTTDVATTGANVGKINTGGAPTIGSESYLKSDTFKNGTNALVGDVGGLMSIGSSSINSASKKMATADGVTNAVGSALSMIPGVGTVAGTALKLVNSIGGNFIRTPKAFKDFKENSQIAQSSSLGGVAAGAQDMGQTIDAYKSSGLVGKLFGKSKKNINQANKVMGQQKLGQDVLNQSNQALMQANTSADMFANKNNMTLMGYDNSSLRFGKNGMVIKKKEVADLRRALKAQAGTKILPRDAEKPKPLRLLNQEERGLWNEFSDYVGKQGYQGHKDLDKADLSRTLWNDYATSKNIKTPYDEFIPAAQNTIATFRNLSINKLRSGFGSIEGKTPKELKDPNFDWDNNYLPGLSKVDGWAGSKTTSFKFPKGAKVDLSKETKEASKDNTPVSVFKDGGTLRNVIVDGALHAHKHNLSEIETYKDAVITNKGVPVITMSEGGEIEQHAEVERDEIIFCLEVTEKLEELMEKGTVEAMIEAGKLLTKELLFNTKDSSSELLDD